MTWVEYKKSNKTFSFHNVVKGKTILCNIEVKISDRFFSYKRAGKGVYNEIHDRSPPLAGRRKYAERLPFIGVGG